MGDRRIALVKGTGKPLRDVYKILRVASPEVTVVESVLDVGARSVDLLLADHDALSPEERRAIAQRVAAADAPRLLLLANSSSSDGLGELFETFSVTNLIARSDENFDGEALLVTVQKLLRRDIFGLEKYFSWGVETQQLELHRSDEKEMAVSRVEELATSIGVNSRLVGSLRTAVDEFVTNAFYNAPVDEQGQRRFAHLPRTAPIALSPQQRVEMRLACDGRRIGVSVTDPFGSIAEQHLLKYLLKCFRKGPDQVDRKEGGAGLGLFYIFESLSHFVVNIDPGRRTEMIGLMDVRGTYKDFAERGKSFNVFVA